MKKWTDLLPWAAKRQGEYLKLKDKGLSNTQVADTLSIDRRAVDRGIKAVLDKAIEDGYLVEEPDDLKILLIDIETAPAKAWIWRLWTEVRSTEQIEADWYILSYAYKWLGNETVRGKSLPMCKRYGKYVPGSEDDRELIEDLWSLVDSADIVIGHNGDNFDLKKIKTRMVQHVMRPPAPYRTVDTLKIARREFSFTSNRLDDLAAALLGRRKLKTDFELWAKCVAGDKTAWEYMLKYNKRDVELLEGVYKRLRAWDRSHPNVAILAGKTEAACTVCTSTDLKPLTDKKTATNVSLFDTYECNTCGHKDRGRQNVRVKEEKDVGLVNAR